MSYPDVLGITQGEARGIPSARSQLQSLHGVCGDDDGGTRWRREQDGSRPTARQRHLRPWSRGTGEGTVDAGLARRRARCLGKRPRLSAQRRRLHRGTAQHLHRIQALKGSGRGETAPASPRVYAVLRYIVLIASVPVAGSHMTRQSCPRTSSYQIVAQLREGQRFFFPDFLRLCFGRLAAILEAEVRSFFVEFDRLFVHVVGLSLHFFNLARLATMWTNLGLFVIGHASSFTKSSECIFSNLLIVR